MPSPRRALLLCSVFAIHTGFRTCQRNHYAFVQLKYKTVS
jgi:hypothetical protein